MYVNISAKGYFTDEEIENRLHKEIDTYAKYQMQYFPLFLKDSGEFIVCCGLRPYDIDKKIYEVGLHLLPEFWRFGSGSEAIKRVIDYAFDDLGAQDIFAGYHPKNEVSGHLLKKFGFSFYKEEYYEPIGLMHPSYTLKKTLK